MQSMTGFGQAQVTSAGGTATVQVASVNAKGLQMHIRTDVRDLGLEEALRCQVREALARGSITVSGSWVSSTVVSIDRDRLIAVWRELAAIAKEAGAAEPSLQTAISCLGQNRSAGDDDTEVHASMGAALAQALLALRAMRAQEGQALQRDLCDKAAQLRALREHMTPVAAARLPRVRAALVQRLTEALGQVPPVPEEHLAREIAVHVDRLDVSEEMTRLDAHLTALDQLLRASEPAGRRLDFLFQEIGREINTTGSKSNDPELTALVLQAKNLLEQMKEQVANVE